MNLKIFLSFLWIGFGFATFQQTYADIPQKDALNRFINQLVKQQHFEEVELREWLSAAEIQQPILDAMAKPAEAKPWQQYRDIFMTDSRIDGGVQFWRDNQAALNQVAQQTGVPAEIIIAIIGVETKYGAHTGKYRVIDALATLGFAYPPRSEFFLKELESFLLLCREEQLDPRVPMGSYAGAMGLPQFMPSSYRAYARDFDLDSRRDIWHNSADAIYSVAHYFVANRWLPGGGITFQVDAANGAEYRKALTKGVKPDISVGQLRQLGLQVTKSLADTEQVKLLQYTFQGQEQLWLGLHNFYVITRYNHSPLYAMVVYELSQAIREKYYNH